MSARVFTTNELMTIAGLTRGQLQRLEEAEALVPARKGHCAVTSLWTIMDVVGACVYKAFFDAKCTATWAFAACTWVSRYPENKLLAEMADKERALVALSPNGDGRIIEPYLQPGASREHRIMVARLDLKRIYERTIKRAARLGQKLAEQGQ
jgi:hypothetical protein